MPCQISTDVHERINDLLTVPTVYRVNPLSSEQSGTNQREEKTPWSFTNETLAFAACLTNSYLE